ncbi:AAA family ATPase [Natronosporangium hydrolyticum]|uniref:AAA family ATPase n=1 Tax=Natronosporangium hydrolyticum TaxID=2811111 RepID=A0A895YD10_9ACTN|nr:AAA family ATPase [Natronosporangium hydrolyticum]QSB13249.1 AAA family ATPase [Natronosporangium hydrolyticum]
MKRVLLTGMSGTGKSTLVAELVARGYRAVDVDHPDFSQSVSAPREELTGLGRGQDWVWREDRVGELLAAAGSGPLFIAGCAPNQVKFYPQFDHIVLLTAPAEVMVERLTTRTNNSFGKDPDQLSHTLALKEAIEPLLRRGAGLVIDTARPLEQIVTELLHHTEAVGRPARHRAHNG